MELQRVPKTFEELQQFLKEQEKILLAQLNQVPKELFNKWDEYSSRVSERQLLLDKVIAEIEEKQDQPAVEFLMVRLHPPLSPVTPGGAGDTQLAPCASWCGRVGMRCGVTPSPLHLLHAAGQPLEGVPCPSALPELTRVFPLPGHW